MSVKCKEKRFILTNQLVNQPKKKRKKIIPFDATDGDVW